MLKDLLLDKYIRFIALFKKRSHIQTIDPDVLEAYMQRTAHMQRWYIEDSMIVDLLRENGFECFHDDPDPRKIDSGNMWYCTNFTRRNSLELLPSGLKLKFEGTSLMLILEEKVKE